VNVTTPDPVAVTPNTNTCEAPAASVIGPAGTGGDGLLTNPPPGFTYTVAVNPVTSVPPTFVTVRYNWNHCPTDKYGWTVLATSSTPGFHSVTAGETTGAIVNPQPAFASVAVTVVVKTTGPAVVAV
jgi:hypothetical protein